MIKYLKSELLAFDLGANRPHHVVRNLLHLLVGLIEFIRIDIQLFQVKLERFIADLHLSMSTLLLSSCLP